jgi:chromosome segregation ATPase
VSSSLSPEILLLLTRIETLERRIFELEGKLKIKEEYLPELTEQLSQISSRLSNLEAIGCELENQLLSVEKNILRYLQSSRPLSLE